MGASVSTAEDNTQGSPKPLRHVDMTRLDRSKLAIKAAFGLLFAVNAAIIAHSLVTDPNSSLSPYHHTNLHKQRLAAAKKAEEDSISLSKDTRPA